jgi:hypothetical protein
MEQTTLIRDTKIADDVFRKIQLGWLDYEFTVYGTAFYADHTIQYKISNFSEKIYSFLDNAGLHNIYPANLMCYTERYSLPAGMKEEKNLQVKIALAKQLRNEFPYEVFSLLNQVAEEIRDDSARVFLEQESERIEGCFDSIRLECFKELVVYSYKTLRLTLHQYENFMKWIDREYKNFEDDFTAKKTSEGALYAIMYQDSNQTHYIEDALLEYVYGKKFQLEQKGIMTTPVHKQLFWYDYQTSFKDARNIYTAKLQSTINNYYLQQIKEIRAANRPTMLCEKWNRKLLEQIKNKIGLAASTTVERYFYQWDIMKN